MKAVVLLCLLLVVFRQAYSSQFNWGGFPTILPRRIRDTTKDFGWEGPGGKEETPAPGAACSIDRHSCGCCMMVQEVNEMKELIGTALTELEMQHEMVAQKFDNLTSSRVAFSAHLSSEGSRACEEPTSQSNIIKYKHPLLNLGGAYNESTGVFTVPYAGLYSMAVTVYSDSGHQDVTLNACASLQVNGVVIAGARDRNKYDQEDSATIVVALHLRAGDEVSVRSSAGCVMCDDGRYNTFSVFLLYATDQL